ncbi:3-oxoacyl-ACP synthase III family protein [Saccharothrix deserti]|uniref:3-oxoacyl-ACP synthase III family protein n=1 Tax=Saccharothrix deserti TaxID=2593674 RepID=UPI00131E5553|nr:ketoacyl-ACP synthase III [Saccharothrix deserti]
MPLQPVGVLGTGAHVPKSEITNDDLARRVGVTPEWILRKTGIETRRYAAEDEATSDLAVRAAEAALDSAGISALDVDHLIVATSTGDHPQPPTAHLVQHRLGARRAAAFDINVVCSGFVHGLALARGLIATRPGTRALVVAADLYSRVLDFDDRRTAVLLGDGAGAAVVGEVPEGAGIVDVELRSKGEASRLIRVEAGGSRLPTSPATLAEGGQYFRMEGRDVRDFVLEQVPPAVADLLARTGTGPADVDHLVPHQPNGPMLADLADALALPSAKVHRTLDRYGNIGSASLPVTLDAAARAGEFAAGDLLLLCAFGGGMSMASCLLRWSTP